jgi:tetratricopeptide (TPR) repeat protein
MIRLSVWVITLLLFSVGSVGAGETPAEEIFVEANKAYKEGRYEEAAAGYAKLIENQPGNGHLHFNLGNARFKAGKLGEAILAYERARLFVPRDEDLRFNLRYALDRTEDSIPEPAGFVALTLSWLGNITLVELLWVFVFVNALLWGILILRLFWKSDSISYLCAVACLLWAAIGVSCGVKWYSNYSEDRAVILVKEVDALAGPYEKDTVLFKLHEGSVVHLEREDEGWALIRFPGEKRGWMKASDLKRINRFHENTM